MGFLAPLPCRTAIKRRGRPSMYPVRTRTKDHTGHRSVAIVSVYTRRADTFADHAGEGLL